MSGSRSEKTPLFWSGDGSAALLQQVQGALAEVDALPEQRLLNTDPEALLAYFLDKYGVEIPAFDRDNLSGTHHERQVPVRDFWEERIIQVPGEAYEFELPFEGDPTIFKLR